MSTKSREVIWGSQIRGAKMTAEHARLRATEAVREADRAETYALVGADGRLWRAGATVPDDWAMPQRSPRLAGGRVQPGKTRASLPLSAIRRATGHANLEAGGLVQMPIVSERPLRAASAHDQADGDARDHALQMGASGTKSGKPATPRTS